MLNTSNHIIDTIKRKDLTVPENFNAFVNKLHTVQSGHMLTNVMAFLFGNFNCTAECIVALFNNITPQLRDIFAHTAIPLFFEKSCRLIDNMDSHPNLNASRQEGNHLRRMAILTQLISLNVTAKVSQLREASYDRYRSTFRTWIGTALAEVPQHLAALLQNLDFAEAQALFSLILVDDKSRQTSFSFIQYYHTQPEKLDVLLDTLIHKLEIYTIAHPTLEDESRFAACMGVLTHVFNAGYIMNTKFCEDFINRCQKKNKIPHPHAIKFLTPNPSPSKDDELEALRNENASLRSQLLALQKNNQFLQDELTIQRDNETSFKRFLTHLSMPTNASATTAPAEQPAKRARTSRDPRLMPAPAQQTFTTPDWEYPQTPGPT